MPNLHFFQPDPQRREAFRILERRPFRRAARDLVLQSVCSIEAIEKRCLLAALTWATAPSLPSAKDHVAIVDDGYGGAYVFSGSVSSLHQAESALDAWSTAISLNNVGPGLGAARANAGIIAFGGRSGSGNTGLEDAIRVDLSLGDNQDTDQLNTPRYLAAAASYDGEVYAIGGRDGNTILSSVETYDSAADAWLPVAAMPAPRYGIEAVDDGAGKFYVAGGGASSAVNSVSNTLYRYDAAANTWDTLAPMPIAVREAGATLAYDAAGNAFIYVVGGFDGTSNVSNVQKYDVVNDSWSIEPAGSSLPVALRGASARTDADGRLEVVGGINASGVAVASVYVSQQLSQPDVSPVITSAAPTVVASAEAGHVWTYQLQATGNPLPVFSLVSGPAGMSITASGFVSWQPTASQVGIQNVSVRATNVAGSVDQSFTVKTVLETVAPSAATNLHVTAVSANSISLSWDAATDNTAVASYNIYRKYRTGWRGTHTAYALVGNSTSTSFTVTGLAGYATQSYVVRAIDTSENVGLNSNSASGTTWSLPTLGLSGAGAPSIHALHTMNFGLYSRANPVATYSLVNGPAGMTVDATTGLVKWTPGVNDVGSTSARFRATNVVGATEFVTSLAVTPDVPVLSYQINPADPSSIYSLIANQPMTIQLRDYSFTPSTYSIVSGPAGMTVDPSTGLASWTPTPADAGAKTVTFSAVNSAGSATIAVPFSIYFTTAPQNVASTNITNTSATISWDPPADASNVAAYTVSVSYRARSGRAYRTYTQTASVGAGVNAYSFTNLVIGKTYTPRVVAIDVAGNRSLTATGASFVSRTIAAAPPPQAALQGLPLSGYTTGGSGPASISGGGLSVNVLFDDPTSAWNSYYDRLTASLQAAGREWGRIFSTNAALEVIVSFDPTIASSAARSITTSFVETDLGDPANPVDVYEQGAAAEINTGIDPNGAEADVELHIGVDPAGNFLTDALWFDPNPTLRTAPIPAGRLDAVSVMIHELGHAIGFNGWIDPATGELPANYESTFDQFAIQSDAGIVFDGEAATAASNAVNPSLQTGDTYHFGSAGDVLSGAGLLPGTRYDLSGVDVAVMKDLGMSIDTMPPVAMTRQFEFETAQQIRIGFNESVRSSLDLSDFTLLRIAGGSVQAVDPATMRLSFDRSSDVATIDFPTATLADGRYVLTLAAVGVSDMAGNRMAFDEQLVFHVLAGDVNRDQRVDFDDLLVLAQNYGQSGRTFSQGNLDYSADGAVTFDDLLILSQRYGMSLFSSTQVATTTTKKSRGGDSVL